MTEIDRIIAQLRHAYRQLVAGAVVDQKQFADGLLGPQIKRLEALAKERTNGEM